MAALRVLPIHLPLCPSLCSIEARSSKTKRCRKTKKWCKHSPAHARITGVSIFSSPKGQRSHLELKWRTAVSEYRRTAAYDVAPNGPTLRLLQAFRACANSATFHITQSRRRSTNSLIFWQAALPNWFFGLLFTLASSSTLCISGQREEWQTGVVA